VVIVGAFALPLYAAVVGLVVAREQRRSGVRGGWSRSPRKPFRTIIDLDETIDLPRPAGEELTEDREQRRRSPRHFRTSHRQPDQA
jgi:hypothetical protein